MPLRLKSVRMGFPAPPPFLDQVQDRLCPSPFKGERTLNLTHRPLRFLPREWGGKAVPIAAFVALGLMLSSPATAQEASLQSQCWKPQDLAANPDERLIRKLDGEPDTRPVKRHLVSFVPTAPQFAGSIRRVKVRDGRKLIALTFDLCEAMGQVTGYDGAIIDTLRQNQVKATFFAGGKWMLDHDQRAEQLMADPLFEIGNHSWSHANMRRLGRDRALREIRNTQAAYEQTREDLSQKQCVKPVDETLSQIPARIGLYRFPYGACNADAIAEVAEQGLLAIQWDVAMADPVLMQTGDRIVKAVLGKVRPGSIIIGHANGRGAHTNDALPVLIPELRKRGYEFVTVSELLAAGDPEISRECYDEKPGDLDRYDTPKVQMQADHPYLMKAPGATVPVFKTQVVRVPGPSPQDQPKPVSQKVRKAKTDKLVEDPLWPAFLKNQ